MAQGNSCQFASIFGFTNCYGKITSIKALKDRKRSSNLLIIADDVYSDATLICSRHSSEFGKVQSRTCQDPNSSGCKGKGARRLKARKYLDGILGRSKVEVVNKWNLGDSYCRQCYTFIDKLPACEKDDTIDLEPSLEESFKKLNAMMEMAGLDTRTIGRRNKHGQKLLFQQMIQELTDELQSWFGIEKSSEDTLKFNKVIERVNAKMDTATHQEAASLLTLFSGIIPQAQMMETFQVSKRTTVKASMCLKTQGLFGEPPAKKGKCLTEEVLKAVREFYMSEENCRISPNMKDVVRVVDQDGNTEDVPYRHLLMSTKELHSAFSKQYPYLKIGRASFQMLRPEFCGLLGEMKKEVCVCTYHDNLEMMYKAVGIRKYTDFLKILVCNPESKECMYRRCNTCLSKESLFKDELKNHCVQNSNLQTDGVTFKQWCLTDRTTQVNSHLELDTFIEHVYQQSANSLKHHLVTKAQAKHYKFIKNNLNVDTALLQGDFSENYSVCYAKESQNLHFKKTQVTLHPFVLYVKVEDAIKPFTFVVVSDTLQHTANTFFAFKNIVINWMKENFPQIKNIEIFTDGAASHYKNRKTLANVMYSQEDLGIEIRHHFYASCHGKGPCDGIGGTAKAIARRASYGGQIINNAEELFRFLERNYHITKTFFIAAEEIENVAKEFKLEDRYKRIGKMTGIRSAHCVRKAQSGNSLELYDFSSDNEPCSVVEKLEETEEFNGDDVTCGDWIAAFYQKDWYYGKIEEVRDADEELLVSFLKGKAGAKSTFSYFEKQPIYVSWSQVICKVSVPNIQTEGRITKYTFSTDIATRVLDSISKRPGKNI